MPSVCVTVLRLLHSRHLCRSRLQQQQRAEYLQNGCLASGASVSPENTPSVSPTWGRSASFTPLPTANVPAFNTSVTFASACTTTVWTIPPNVFTIAVYLWGSGGQWSHGAADRGYGNGGAGAFVSGLAAVTPGQVLSVTVGGVSGGELCGWGGSPQPGSGGGFTAVSRLNETSSMREYLAVAAGGGGGGMYNNGLPGLGFQSSATACGLWAPAGQNYTLWASGAGGGGWQGGTAGTQDTFGVGTGGTSCGGGLISGTAISMSGSAANSGAGGTESPPAHLRRPAPPVVARPHPRARAARCSPRAAPVRPSAWRCRTSWVLLGSGRFL